MTRHQEAPDATTTSETRAYPHAKGREYALQGNLPTRGDTVCRLRRAGPVWRDDNFTRVRVDPGRLQVEVYSRKGKKLGTKRHSF